MLLARQLVLNAQLELTVINQTQLHSSLALLAAIAHLEHFIAPNFYVLKELTLMEQEQPNQQIVSIAH